MCTRCEIEVAALADASTKTSSNDWQVIVDVISSWASHFTISQQCVRWAVVSYADSARESIALTRYNDLQSLQAGIRALQLINGGSDLLTALQLLRTQVTHLVTHLVWPYGGPISMRPRALWTMQDP